MCSPSGIDKPLRVWLIFRALVFLLPKTFKLFDFPIFWHWTYLMKVISRNARCALNYISTSLLPVMKHPTITNKKKDVLFHTTIVFILVWMSSKTILMVAMIYCHYWYSECCCSVVQSKIKKLKISHQSDIRGLYHTAETIGPILVHAC